MAEHRKAAVVTGGGTGVGRATALELAARGYDVLINYSKSKGEAEATSKEVESAGAKCIVVQADVADDAACKTMIARALEAFGGLDLLVNNAGTTEFISHGDLDSATADVWQKLYAVNVVGAFQCVRAAKDSLHQRQGQVVNVASTAGITGMGSSIPYCASKAALINMTMSLARALGPTIRVNAVAPGFITGRWLQGGLGEHYDVVKQAFESRVPLQRVCDPIDVAHAIMSFVDGSALVTGQTLVCDGGMTLGEARL